MILDLFILITSWNVTLWILDNELFYDYFNIHRITLALLLSILVYSQSGHYKAITRFIGSYSLYTIAARNAIIILILILFSILAHDRSIILYLRYYLTLWLLATVLLSSYRFILRDFILIFNSKKSEVIKKVAIYGAGMAGAQLASLLRITKGFKILAFIDDSNELKKRALNGIRIIQPIDIKYIEDDLDQILLAIPSISKDRKRSIISSINKYDVEILQVPSIEDISSGRAKIDSLKPISIEDLLGRQSVTPFKELLGPSIEGLEICVTGAGGSIGSELCRQILKFKPKVLIMFDNSEENLYLIDNELRIKNHSVTELLPILGDASNLRLVEEVFNNYKVKVVFHAAAYKHVPLVESNPIQGLSNNLLSTLAICKASNKTLVRKVILISTDKAVRPTNIMGASKRLAELILQGFADAQIKSDTNNKKCFTMVRFGNVLNSSGSVVPLFKKQITSGGPVTLTHNEVVRYFMTIREAAELVLQASVMAEGGDVFLLEMGNPVKIRTLAEKMIKLSGLKVKDKANPEGDIEIKVTGLRAGEKLYEELLIDKMATKTTHPLIYKAKESHIPLETLEQHLLLIEEAISLRDEQRLLKELKILVPEWSQNS